jgi:RNA polymerase sigma factor (sigma-70 family)
MLICRTSQKRRRQSFFFQELRRISVNPSTKGSYWHLLAFRSKQNPFGTCIALTKGMRARAEPDQWASIINQAKSGDSAAFDQLAFFYQYRLLHFISRRVSNQADSADLCQEVLFRAYSKLNTFQGGSSFDTWLFSIAKRAVAEYYRSGLCPTVLRQAQIDTPPHAPEKRLPTYDHCFEEICDIHNQIRKCLDILLPASDKRKKVYHSPVCRFGGWAAARCASKFPVLPSMLTNLLRRSRHRDEAYPS